MQSTWIFLTMMFALQPLAHAYPEFIGYGYNSCLTCHYNGFGNGALNDYGRALWASTIAARPFGSRASDEDLADRSGPLGNKKLPEWWKPGLKYRGLSVQTNPGSQKSKSRWIDMQADFSSALVWGEREKFVVMLAGGYVPQPYANRGTTENKENFISREHYLRTRLGRNFYAYAGMMDRVYGIRIVDHTAFSRSQTGLAQNDQTHGVVLQYTSPNLEAGLHAQLGNLYQKSDLQQKGGSGTIEYQFVKNTTIGASVMMTSNSYVAWTRYALHSRIGLGEGSAVLAEIGTILNDPKEGSLPLKRSIYGLVEPMMKLARGLNIYLQSEIYQDAVESDFYQNVLSFERDLQLRAALGFLYFPMQRVEIRVDAQNNRSYSQASSAADQWALRSQLHLSF